MLIFFMNLYHHQECMKILYINAPQFSIKLLILVMYGSSLYFVNIHSYVMQMFSLNLLYFYSVSHILSYM